VQVLHGLPKFDNADMLVGTETSDDAGVFRLRPDLAIVNTVDFFTPIVDDPYLFGQIAAANSLSDIYAMGGEPKTCMNIVCFPKGKMDIEILGKILKGGADKVKESGAVVIGGHSIIDEELKFGLAVTGRVHPDRIFSNARGTVGDRLVLTKPLGTGVLATAAKRGTLGTRESDALYASMCLLNAGASRAAATVGVRCATDVTGFGLLGHASHIANGSDVTIVIHADRVPSLPGAREAWEAGIRTGGAERNDEYLESRVEWGSASDATRALLVDPQTSGGLLVAVPANRVAEYLSLVPQGVEIGEIVARREHGLVLA